MKSQLTKNYQNYHGIQPRRTSECFSSLEEEKHIFTNTLNNFSNSGNLSDFDKLPVNPTNNIYQ